MKYFSMFSGVEGFGLGIPDGEPIGFSEWDKYASMVLKYHFPKVKNYGDCTTIQWNKVPDFDLLTGGSPCQDFSIAGKRRGLGGSRSSLAWEFIRALRAKSPRYFIWENVKGALSSRNGWDFANIISAFSESGYSLWWQVLNAKDFGVPQNRERIFVVGFREGNPKEVFFERQASELSDREGEGGVDKQVSFTLRTNYGSSFGSEDYVVENNLQYIGAIMSEKNKKWLDDGKKLSRNFPQGQRVYSADGIATNIASQAGGLGAKTGLYAIPVLTPDRKEKRQNGRRMKEDGEPSFTLNTQDTQGIYNGESIRKLTPKECERLMSWKDEWTRWGINEKGEKVEISDSQRYKMCGNGVVSNVVREVVKNLL